MYGYILWLAIFIVAPTITMWVLFPFIIKKYRKVLLLCALWALVFSIPWDLWAVYTKIWYFPPENILGIWLCGLPLEEYLFIVLVTVLVSTFTLVLKYKVFDQKLS